MGALGAIILLIGFVGGPALIIFYYKRGSYTENDQKFSQAGVTVNYGDGTVVINGHRYPAAAINGTRWEVDTRGHQNIAYAYIKVDDMGHPTHKIKFIRKKHCEQFLERFALAIRKAGGTDLQDI